MVVLDITSHAHRRHRIIGGALLVIFVVLVVLVVLDMTGTLPATGIFTSSMASLSLRHPRPPPSDSPSQRSESPDSRFRVIDDVPTSAPEWSGDPGLPSVDAERIATMNPTITKSLKEGPRISEPNRLPSQRLTPDPLTDSVATTGSPSPPSKLPKSATNPLSPAKTRVFDDHGTKVLYRPGFLTVNMHGLILSEGLTARIIADKRKRVKYVNGQLSTARFHSRPDFGATFVDTRVENPGGWVYVSNSELNVTGTGGVGALTFNADGDVIDYKMVLTNTTMNCGGGRTPWHTWVSCEELDTMGNIYQVDPFGSRVAQVSTLGKGYGNFESFTFDVRDKTKPRFFASEDRKRGAVRRFTPDVVDWDIDPWSMLHGEGLIEFLLMHPPSDNCGTFTWTTDEEAARDSANRIYPECEGIDVNDGTIYLIAKNIQKLFILDLDAGTYQKFSTEHGVFDGNPDQVSRILSDEHHDLIYFTEDGGANAGVHGRNALGDFFTILEGPGYIDETTGLTFSPDEKHLYVAIQKNGILFDVTRKDQLAFQGKTLNVKYHNDALGL